MKRSSSPRPADAAAVSPACDASRHPARRTRRDSLPTDEAFERAAALFRAAGDVARLKLLGRLADGEWCVTELADAAGAGLSTISQQLRMLRGEHIVTRRREGKHIYYALTDGHVRELILNALEHANERPGEEDDDEHEDHPTQRPARATRGDRR